MIAHILSAPEMGAILIALLTVITLTYVIRDRRYHVMHSLYEVEREQTRVLSEQNGQLLAQLAECGSRVSALEARPDLETHARLLERMIEKLESHDAEMHIRLDNHEARAQERTDAQIAVMREIALKLEAT